MPRALVQAAMPWPADSRRMTRAPSRIADPWLYRYRLTPAARSQPPTRPVAFFVFPVRMNQRQPTDVRGLFSKGLDPFSIPGCTPEYLVAEERSQSIREVRWIERSQVNPGSSWTEPFPDDLRAASSATRYFRCTAQYAEGSSPFEKARGHPWAAVDSYGLGTRKMPLAGLGGLAAGRRRERYRYNQGSAILGRSLVIQAAVGGQGIALEPRRWHWSIWRRDGSSGPFKLSLVTDFAYYVVCSKARADEPDLGCLSSAG